MRPQRSEEQNLRLRVLYNSYPTPQSLFVAYSRDMQVPLIGIEHSALAMREDVPTLFDVANLYAETNAISWLKIQFATISDFAGANNKMNAMQLETLARMVLTQYQHYNLAEIAHFIGRFNAAFYEEFYGSVDPVKIMKAMKIYNSERVESIEEYRKSHQEGRNDNETLFTDCDSYSTFLAIKKLADNDDETAKLYLLPPNMREREITPEELLTLKEKVKCSLIEKAK